MFLRNCIYHKFGNYTFSCMANFMTCKNVFYCISKVRHKSIFFLWVTYNVLNISFTMSLHYVFVKSEKKFKNIQSMINLYSVIAHSLGGTTRVAQKRIRIEWGVEGGVREGRVNIELYVSWMARFRDLSTAAVVISSGNSSTLETSRTTSKRRAFYSAGCAALTSQRSSITIIVC